MVARASRTATDRDPMALAFEKASASMRGQVFSVMGLFVQTLLIN